MPRFDRAAALFGALVVAVCAAPSCRRASVPPLTLPISSKGPMSFPPSDETLLPREALKKSTEEKDDAFVHMSSPSVDDQKHFQMEGQHLEVTFDEPLFRVGEAPPKLTVTPAFAAKTEWSEDGQRVVMTAEKMLDPKKTFTLDIPSVVAPSGHTFEAFHGTFEAVPEILVAGKTIHYVPEKGRPRLISLQHGDDTLSQTEDIVAVYDQAVDLGIAQSLVTLKMNDKRIAASIRHPATGIFEGQKVDPRYVLLVRPGFTPKIGDALDVEVRSLRKDDETDSGTFTIQGVPKLVSVGCMSASQCTSSDGHRVKGPNSATLQLTYDRTLGVVARESNVTISPPVRNLWVSGWGNLEIGGDFEPATTYRVDVHGVRDTHGGWIAPSSLTFTTNDLPASATIDAGVSVLDEAGIKAYAVTTRNVVRGTLLLRPLPANDAKAFAEAMNGHAPESVPAIEVSFKPRAQKGLIDTNVDLSSKVERGRPYLATIRIDESKAETDTSASGSAVIYPAGPHALGAHVHQTGNVAIVEVFRLANGEPVPNVKIDIGGASGTTDAVGSARVAGRGDVLIATAADASLMLPLTEKDVTKADALYPELVDGHEEKRSGDAGVIVTDRGIYRPGSKILVKAFLRRTEGEALVPKAKAPVQIQAIDATGSAFVDRTVTTDARGAISEALEIDKHAHTGKVELRLLEDGALVTSQNVHVADFETPRFKVDVESTTPGEVRVVGKHLFGAALDGAHVSWVMKRVPADIDGSGHPELHFDRERSWFEETSPEKPVTGEGTLDKDGILVVKTAMPAAAAAMAVSFEADVSDASNRHVAGTLKKIDDPFPRHAGIALTERFGDGTIDVKLGVVDQNGHAVSGAKVTAKVERIKWSAAREKTESGATVERWRPFASTVGSCDVTTASTPVRCSVRSNVGGQLRVTARVDGHDDASTYYWSEGWGGEVPSNGKKIPIVLDRASYDVGQTAHVLVQNPWKKAIATLTIEQGETVRHETKRIEGPSITFDVPVTIANGPFFHAAVSLLPIGEKEADYRIAVARVPVKGGNDRLEVNVVSNQKNYRPREKVDVTIEVKRGGKPLRNVDVALSVADEGVLRLTSFHAKDPVLRASRGLDFDIYDSRYMMLQRRERAHVAGEGDGGEEAPDTRRKFVETAAWMPGLVTNDQGRIKTSFTLPDNVGELRMMAVALDTTGVGGSTESSFLVNKPLMIEPIVPRFALRGDTFEIGAMAYNQTDAEVKGVVTIAGTKKDVTIPARGHERVAFPFNAQTTTKLRFAFDAEGKAGDAVEIPFRVDVPGVDEHPRISGVFGKEQEIHVDVPADAVFDDDAMLVIKTGSALFPELGQRLAYLLEYPHGCVEQTTSSTLPLLAARTLMPWTGTKPLEDVELRRRIQAGIDRLATMQTSSGGLSYWPGGNEPHLHGTAYAMRALVRAREMGIEKPKMIERVTTYLETQLAQGTDETRIAVAEALAMAGKLPASSTDALFDEWPKLESYALASLALALSSLPNQKDRVEKLLDELESKFDAEGTSKAKHGENDWIYWGSSDRDRSQAVIALSKLRRSSKVLPILAQRLARHLERWNTQGTAWSLVALSDFVATESPNSTVDVQVKVEGWAFDNFEKLAGGSKEVRVPLKVLAGHPRLIRLVGDSDAASAFSMEATYKRPIASSPRVAHRAAVGLSLYREFTTPEGKAVDLAHVKVGSLVRVTIRANISGGLWSTSGYVAVADRVAAGFDPIDPDLSTTASLPDASAASHFDIRPDRVDLYFDRPWKDIVATYFVRATTKGTFTLPPASGEMMYEPGSDGWTDGGRVTVE